MRVSTSMLSWDKERKTFSAEISDLGAFRFEQVYVDACDEGLTLVSAATGREAQYAVNAEECDQEGDIRYWELVPTRESVRGCPSLQGTKILLFND